MMTQKRVPPASTAILVYVPNTKAYIDQFWGLYESSRIGKNKDVFEFVVICQEEAVKKLPEDGCHFFIRDELALQELYRTKYNNEPYRYANSFQHFVESEVIQFLKDNYTFCLRIDVDTFLTPDAYKLGVPLGEVKVGHGGYYNESVKRHLQDHCHRIGVPYSHDYDIGSTWYGATQDIIELGTAAIKHVQHLINEDPMFCKEEGSWPEWYAGVITMYASHLAFCEKSNIKVIHFNFDMGTTDATPLDGNFTLHCWHSGDFFSKFRFADGEYDDVEVTDWRRSWLASDYAFFCATKGRDERRKVHLYDGESAKSVDGRDETQSTLKKVNTAKHAVIFQVHNLEKYSIKNFNLLKDNLPENHDLFLSVDVTNTSVKDFLNAYGVSSVIPTSKHDTILQQTLKQPNICFWSHIHVPLLNFLDRAGSKYDYYYLIENDLYSDDWSNVFSELSFVECDFLASQIVQHPDNPISEDYLFSPNWVHWSAAETLPYKDLLGFFGPFERYSKSALEFLLHIHSNCTFAELFVPTSLYANGFSIKQLRLLWRDGILTSAIYHDKSPTQESLNTQKPFFNLK